jgi:hypothetical protein
MPLAPPTSERPSLQPPQFRLQTLLLWVTGLCVLFAAAQFLQPIGFFALLLLILAVLAHVAGNAIGTRLRENGDTASVADAARIAKLHQQSLQQEDYAPITRLGKRSDLGWSIFFWIGGGALLFSSTIGGLLAWLIWDEANVVSLLIAGISTAVLGGFLGFASGCFWTEFRRAWKEAEQ